jgi:hypothetical protein
MHTVRQRMLVLSHTVFASVAGTEAPAAVQLHAAMYAQLCKAQGLNKRQNHAKLCAWLPQTRAEHNRTRHAAHTQ